MIYARNKCSNYSTKHWWGMVTLTAADSQGEPHDIVTTAVSIFAVVDQRHTKPMFREVSPLVATNLGKTKNKQDISHRLPITSAKGKACLAKKAIALGRSSLPRIWPAPRRCWRGWDVSGDQTVFRMLPQGSERTRGTRPSATCGFRANQP